MKNPHLTHNISEFILSKEEIPLLYKDFLEYTDISIIKYPTFNKLELYKKDLMNESVRVKLSDIEYSKYKYKPELLSYDLYNYTDLYFILMYINNIYSVKDFKFKELYVIPPDILFTLLSKMKIN